MLPLSLLLQRHSYSRQPTLTASCWLVRCGQSDLQPETEMWTWDEISTVSRGRQKNDATTKYLNGKKVEDEEQQQKWREDHINNLLNLTNSTSSSTVKLFELHVRSLHCTLHYTTLARLSVQTCVWQDGLMKDKGGSSGGRGNRQDPGELQ